MSALGQKQSSELAALRPKIYEVVGCSTCAIGIAIDVVGRRWSDGPYEDWKGERFGHDCAFSKGGATPDQDRRLRAIEAEYAGTDRAA